MQWRCVQWKGNMEIWSTVLLEISLVVENVLDKEVVSGHIRKATMRAVLHPAMTKAVADALQKNQYFVTTIATFVS